MRIHGDWLRTDTGEVVPRLLVEIRAGDGQWLSTPFLIDTGAERTAFTYDLLYALQLEPEPSDGSYLTGVGGVSATVLLATTLRLRRDDGQFVPIHGTFYGLTDPIALEMSVLGRDVLGHFAAIVDRPGKTVALLAGQHRYQVITSNS